MVARVVISALILNCAITIPLTAPTTPPAAIPANMPSTALPVAATTTAASTPDMEIIVSTDRSKCPDARQNSIVQDTMPTVATETASAFMLKGEKNSGTNTEIPTNSAANTTSMPAFAHKFDSARMPLGCFLPVKAAPAPS